MIDKRASLTPALVNILVDKGTEAPGSSIVNTSEEMGTYLCRQCGLALFRASHKFISSCGWPSFDDEIANAIKRQPDADGHRTEINCARCDGHLGHVFMNEGFTDKQLRHCVNGAALDFVADDAVTDSAEAIVAGGCFWGLEYHFAQLPGVLLVESGYIGGGQQDPLYQEVCSGQTGHVEAIRILYDAQKLTYQAVLKLFFELHDFTQQDGQGPDIGEQYLSKIFVYDQQQHEVAADLLSQLEQLGHEVATEIKPMAPFWRAEDYHQQYYQRKGSLPYCHQHRPIEWLE